MATILSDAAFPSNSAVLVFAPDVSLNSLAALLPEKTAIASSDDQIVL